MPAGAALPADAPRLPLCLWAVTGAVPGRVEAPEIATPCLGLSLHNPTLLGLGPSQSFAMGAFTPR